jgi:hypothetical protein
MVQDIRYLITIILDPLSTKYPWWGNMMLLTLHRYALDDHNLIDKLDDTAYWYHYDRIMLTWMIGTLSGDGMPSMTGYQLIVSQQL